MHSNQYTTFFILALTSIVALVLAGMFTALKPIHDANEAIYNKKEILAAVDPNASNMGDEEVAQLFSTKVKQYVLDAKGEVIEAKTANGMPLMAEKIKMDKERKKPEEERVYPLYIYEGEEGPVYIVSVYGKGLWDAIWGSIALKSDFNTVAGVAFGHKGETPGLGAEIKDNTAWKKSFIGTKIFTEQGEFVSVEVKKGGAKDRTHQVDAISGATVTCDGVTDMMKDGIAVYLPYFESLKKK